MAWPSQLFNVSVSIFQFMFIVSFYLSFHFILLKCGLNLSKILFKSFLMKTWEYVVFFVDLCVITLNIYDIES